MQLQNFSFFHNTNYQKIVDQCWLLSSSDYFTSKNFKIYPKTRFFWTKYGLTPKADFSHWLCSWPTFQIFTKETQLLSLLCKEVSNYNFMKESLTRKGQHKGSPFQKSLFLGSRTQLSNHSADTFEMDLVQPLFAKIATTKVSECTMRALFQQWCCKFHREHSSWCETRCCGLRTAIGWAWSTKWWWSPTACRTSDPTSSNRWLESVSPLTNPQFYPRINKE